MGNKVTSQTIGPVRRCLLALLAATTVAALALVLPPIVEAGPVGRASEGSNFPYESSQSCLDCHGQPGLEMTLSDGEKLSLFVDDAAMTGSVHAGKLICTDCHARVTDYPHKKLTVASKREYSMAQYEACKRCHFANYTDTLDGTHYQALQSGNQNAPLCTDCHGYHVVTKPDQPRSKILQICGSCHHDISEAYSKSVHGVALANGAGEDVPICTDCHGTHLIRNASTASFRSDSPEMCGGCHGDATLMAKYGLSANVFKTYLQDFHGSTVALTRQHDPNSWPREAVCSDCHGVHDIKSVKNGDTAELKRQIATTCQKCHQDAGANFPDAWLSHYELSLGKAPLPWLVRAGYALFIPFIVAGLALHVVVDLWRLARNR